MKSIFKAYEDYTREICGISNGYIPEKSRIAARKKRKKRISNKKKK